MDTRHYRLPVLPYLVAVFLLALSVLLDTRVRATQEVASQTFDFVPAVLVILFNKLILGILGVYLVWLVTRAGFTIASGIIFTIFGVVLLFLPMLFLLGNMPESLLFTLGDFTNFSGAIIASTGIVSLLTKALPAQESNSSAESKHE